VHEIAGIADDLDMPRTAGVTEGEQPLRAPERMLRHDDLLYQVPLGCAGCRDRPLCGGLAVEADLWNCLSLCCGTPNTCDRVCRNNPKFAARVHEIGGFGLSLAPAPDLPMRTLPSIIPEVFHSVGRRRPFAPVVASVSLYRMFKRQTGDPKYPSHEDLCSELMGVSRLTDLPAEWARQHHLLGLPEQ